MSAAPLVVGADGFLGGIVADALGAARVVFRDPQPGEHPISALEELVPGAGCVVNAAGFPGRPGLDAAAYRESHAGLTRRIASLLAPGARFVQISSASVLGRGAPLRADARPAPDRFAIPGYARAKLEAEEVARTISKERGILLVVLRPAVVYGPGAHGFLSRSAGLARRGFLFDLRPRSVRHHHCSAELLAATVRRVGLLGAPRSEEPLLVADPFVLEQRELVERLRTLARGAGQKLVPVPLPARLLGWLLAQAPASSNPRLDLRARGEFLRAVASDTVYEPDVFARLDLDPRAFQAPRTLEPYLAGAFAGRH